jgi:NTP pyrophosphatase (non-canonical NTP hydrolase)
MQQKFDLEKYLDFIKAENAHIAKRDNYDTFKESVLYWVAKLGEESGEFTNEILIKLQFCRKEKIRDNSKELASEFADCVNILFLLADKLGIDAGGALMERAAAIAERNKKA